MCRLPRADRACDGCSEHLCRTCSIIISPEEDFCFEIEPTRKPTGSTFCGLCEDRILNPLREKYAETLAAARQVNVIPKAYRGRVTIIKKGTHILVTGPWADTKQAELALAFLAARKGFNAIINTQVVSKKVRNFGYQRTEYNATALPADINERIENW